MKTSVYSLLVLLSLASPLVAQNSSTTTSTTVITAPGPTPTVVPESAAAPAKPGNAPITNPNEAPLNATGRRTMYQVVDSNADGQITRSEFEAYGAALKDSPRGGATNSGSSGSGSNGNAVGSTTDFRLLDVNSDGYLNQEEFARSPYHEGSETPAVDTAREPGMSRTNAAAGVAGTATTTTNTAVGGTNLFAAVDTNLDGFINLQEFERYHSTAKGGGKGAETYTGPTFDASFQQLDSDSDRKLSLREFARANAQGNLDTTVRTPSLDTPAGTR